jgi:predicted nucleotide-binding protein
LSEFEKWLRRNWKDYSFTRWKKDFGQRLVGKYDGGTWNNDEIVLIYHFVERKPTVEDFAEFLKDLGKFYDDYADDYDVDGAYFIVYQEYDKKAFSLMLQRFDEELKGLVRIKRLGEELDASLAGTPTKQEATTKKEVFIVHGREKAPAFELARILEKEFKLETTLLQEQPHGGRTLIEKLEDYSNVGYAFVIVTPDDVGGLKGEELKERPRQNVILEWGHFIAKIGRNRTCILLKGNIDLPSDMQGVGYHSFNDSVEEVFLKIKRELKNANLIN